MQKAENDFPEKRADLDSRLSSLRGSVAQSDTLWQSSTEARKQAAAETGLARAAFPEECGWDLDGALADRDEGAQPNAAPDHGG